MQDAMPFSQAKRRTPRCRKLGVGRWLLAGVLVMGVLSPLPARAESAPQLQPASNVDVLLQATGVFDRITAVSVMVEQELSNLEASPLFSLDEISQVRHLLAGVREDALYQQMQAALARELPAESLLALQVLEQRSEWRDLARGEQGLQSPAQQEQWRLYQLRNREMPPASNRVSWMQALDDARYQTRFEVALRMALRKNVLAAVALVKTRQPLAESALENELRDYRAKLEADLAQKATSTYLFLYRKTPTERVQATVAMFQDPHYRRFMEVCEQALQHSFRLARAQTEDNLRVVQVNTP